MTYEAGVLASRSSPYQSQQIPPLPRALNPAILGITLPLPA